MTLLIILIAIVILIAVMAEDGVVVVLALPATVLYMLYSADMSKDYYLEPEIKKIEIQNFILKDGTQAFILYKVDGDPEEKAETISLNIVDGPESYFEVKRPKPRKWYFINLAFERQKIYIGRDDLKSRI